MIDLTLLDYIYISVLFVSTVWAFVRGGVYETLTMGAWVLAALVARHVSPHLNEIFQGILNKPEASVGTIIAAYFIVFFVILLVFSFINGKLRERVQDSMMKVTDHTFGIVFGIIRGIVIMGFVYWGLLWYYSDSPLPASVAASRSRPIMQLTAVKMHEWFVPGDSKLLEDDMTGEKSAQDIFDNLVNPAVQTAIRAPAPDAGGGEQILPDVTYEDAGVGYGATERGSLENKLLQLENLVGEEDE